ncbi:MAG: hypothetical protein IJJ00_00340 [Erysipelotrichaceae bacterium]|nr:hypothetical protein [Erysipelotrichaceae bacterium]
MEKINSINEVIAHLKDRELLTGNGKDIFVYKKDKVYRYFNGSSIAMSPEDFISLYGQETFYLYEENGVYIDEEKDEDYYRYYRK